MKGARMGDAGVYEPERCLPLVVGGEQRRWGVQQPHAAAPERGDLDQSRFHAVKRRRHVEARQRDVAGPKPATCVGRAKQLRSNPQPPPTLDQR